jgi:hypothetical protein
VKDGKSTLHTTTDLQAFALIVTVEPYFAVTQPSDLVVAQKVIRRDTKAGVEPVEVRYELISRDTYNSQVQPIGQPVYAVSNKTPLDLLEARNDWGRWEHVNHLISAWQPRVTPPRPLQNDRHNPFASETEE